MDDGFAITHNFTVVTVFSASNYCGKNNNYGAVCTFEWEVRRKECVESFLWERVGEGRIRFDD